ncbi:MAG: hypothetical protein FJX42_09690, partial [Alphaproteobacteria bacterium]|nr:hypothetical protein [Alphaproteobacteria bacterium]
TRFHARISQRIQVSAATMLAILASWGTYSTVNYLLHAQIVADKDSQIANARTAYRGLLSEVADYQKKFQSLAREISENQGAMSTGLEQTAQLQKNISSVENELLTTEQEREQATDARDRLQAQLVAIEKSMNSLAARNFTTKGTVPPVETELQAALAERNQALFEANDLRRQMREVENKLASLRETQLESVRGLAERTAGFLESTEKVLQIAGLDPTQLIAAGQPKGRGKRGLGGPFIPAKPPKGEDSDDPFMNEMEMLSGKLARWESLQGAMQYIPLAAPLTTYNINSAFGKRIDPVNGMWAAHYGLDLGAPRGAAVHATAPGIVIYAGFKDKFGHLVEIDHGFGLVTRYAHLDKTTVKKGDNVNFNKTIGTLGNSGRSTGAHLHYEVLFKDKPKNPMNFIKAGRHVFKE